MKIATVLLCFINACVIPHILPSNDIVVTMPPQNTTYSVTLPSLKVGDVLTTSTKVGKYLITHCLLPGLGALVILSVGGVALAHVSGNLLVFLFDKIYDIPAAGPLLYAAFWGTAWIAEKAIKKGGVPTALR